jgi:hypothetical protein
MGSPKTADEADDSYRALGVGRGLPWRHYCLQVSVVSGCSNGARLSALACATAFVERGRAMWVEQESCA